MKIRPRFVLAFLCMSLIVASAWAQHRDPLTDKESDDLREVAQEPLKRMKLLVKYATERLDTIERVQTEPKSGDRGKKMHDALEDFRSIVDELDDNVDDYSSKSSDLRKALNEVVTAETQFVSRLQGIKSVAEDPKNADIYKLYSFALQDAIEAVSLSLDDAKKTLEEQNAALSKKK
ncbi:MAG TPA: hypothetical protein VN577_07065 [Terriglobales bacterium]|nr:hypothetical protein [Terriglobales bacterium]